MIKKAMKDAGLEVLEGYRRAQAQESYSRYLERSYPQNVLMQLKKDIGYAWNVKVEMWGHDPNTDGQASRDLGIMHLSTGSASGSPFLPWEYDAKVKKALTAQRKQAERAQQQQKKKKQKEQKKTKKRIKKSAASAAAGSAAKRRRK